MRQLLCALDLLVCFLSCLLALNPLCVFSSFTCLEALHHTRCDGLKFAFAYGVESMFPHFAAALYQSLWNDRPPIGLCKRLSDMRDLLT